MRVKPEKQMKRMVLACSLSILSAIAFSIKHMLPEDEAILQLAGTENVFGRTVAYINILLNGYDFLWLVAALAFFFLYKQYLKTHTGIQAREAVLAGLLSLFMLLGNSFKAIGTAGLILENKPQIVISLLCFVGYAAQFHVFKGILQIRNGGGNVYAGISDNDAGSAVYHALRHVEYAHNDIPF